MTIRELWLKLLAFLTGSGTNIPATAALERGISCFDAGDLDAAIAAFTEAIRLNSKCADAYCSRGDARREKDELDLAIADYTEAIRLHPGHALAYCGRGLAYYEHEEADIELPISDFTQAIRLDPHLSRAYRARGDVYRGILDIACIDEGESDIAIADYTEAIRLDRLGKVIYRYADHLNTYNSCAWLLAVCPHAEYRDGHRAVEYATYACKVALGENPYCQGTLAAAYAEAGEFAQAIYWQTKAIEIATPDYDVPAAESRLELYKAGKAYRQD